MAYKLSLKEGQGIIWGNALNQITKSLEHHSRKSKLSPRAMENMSLQKLKQLRTLYSSHIGAHITSSQQWWAGHCECRLSMRDSLKPQA